MARINRSDVIQKAVNDLAISTSADKAPSETLDKVQLTYDLNKSFSSFIITNNVGTSTSMTSALPTVSAGGETYITSINLGFAKDATCDCPDSAVTVSVTPDASNVSTRVLSIPVLTLTAHSATITKDFAYPLKVKNGSNVVSSTNTFTVGKLQKSMEIIGFTTSSN